MKKSLGITETTPHGFRPTFKTLAKDKLDASNEATEYCLSHSPDFDPYGYYRGQCLSERRALMQVWADYLDELKADNVDLKGLRVKFAELKEFYQDQPD
jgi:integrase